MIYILVSQCQVSSSGSYDSCVFSVPPTINKEHLKTQLKVVQNRTAYIDCPVTGIPQPSIMWLKDGFPLLDWPYEDLLLVGNDRRLEVSNAQLDDGGTYRCQATNPAGQIQQDFSLEVQGELNLSILGIFLFFFVVC